MFLTVWVFYILYYKLYFTFFVQMIRTRSREAKDIELASEEVAQPRGLVMGHGWA